MSSIRQSVQLQFIQGRNVIHDDNFAPMLALVPMVTGRPHEGEAL